MAGCYFLASGRRTSRTPFSGEGGCFYHRRGWCPAGADRKRLRRRRDRVDDECDCSRFGIDRGIDFAKLREATLLIRRGLPFYGTNPDLTFPTPEGLIPGAGSFLALLSAASGVNPIVAGKPEPFILEFALERLATPRERTLVVGDRLETDIAGGQAIGCSTALVLSGVSTAEMGEAWNPQVDIITQDLTSLLA